MQRQVPGAEPEALGQVSRRLGEQEAALDLHQALSPGGVRWGASGDGRGLGTEGSEG